MWTDAQCHQPQEKCKLNHSEVCPHLSGGKHQNSDSTKCRWGCGGRHMACELPPQCYRWKFCKDSWRQWLWTWRCAFWCLLIWILSYPLVGFISKTCLLVKTTCSQNYLWKIYKCNPKGIVGVYNWVEIFMHNMFKDHCGTRGKKTIPRTALKINSKSS